MRLLPSCVLPNHWHLVLWLPGAPSGGRAGRGRARPPATPPFLTKKVPDTCPPSRLPRHTHGPPPRPRPARPPPPPPARPKSAPASSPPLRPPQPLAPFPLNAATTPPLSALPGKGAPPGTAPF